MAIPSQLCGVASKEVTWSRIAGTPALLPDGGLHQRVAFRAHPVQDESVEQPDQRRNQAGKPLIVLFRPTSHLKRTIRLQSDCRLRP